MNSATAEQYRVAERRTQNSPSSAGSWPSFFRLLTVCIAVCWGPTAAAQQQDAIGLAPTPPMGWASWNYYFCNYDEQTIRNQADALVSTGMRDLGYRYVIIQECIAPARDANGRLVPDAQRFPHGIPALVDYIHSKGLKAGIYTDVGPFTCFSSTHYQGSYDHEAADAQTFASWGIDLIEVDFCNKPKDHTAKELYGRMAEAIRNTGRPMLLYICSWGEEQPWEWATGMAQLWRTTEDISYDPGRVKWESVVRNFEINASHAAFTAPNNWNDPDMLEVGNAGLTPIESRSHMSMWAISAAPLWAGTDLTKMHAGTWALFTNAEVIAIDQDPLGAGVRQIYGGDGREVWAKPLGTWSGAAQAVLLLNLKSSAQTMSVSWQDLGLRPNAEVRDLWEHRYLGRFRQGYSANIPAHGSLFLKISGVPSTKKAVVYEAEWPGNMRPEGASLASCRTCSGGYAVRLPLSGSKVEKKLTFPQVDVVPDGRFRISVQYLEANSPGNSLAITVNGSPPVSVKLSKPSGSVKVRVPLHAGRNKVGVESDGQVSIDTLTVSR